MPDSANEPFLTLASDSSVWLTLFSLFFLLPFSLSSIHVPLCIFPVLSASSWCACSVPQTLTVPVSLVSVPPVILLVFLQSSSSVQLHRYHSFSAFLLSQKVAREHRKGVLQTTAHCPLLSTYLVSSPHSTNILLFNPDN